MTTCGRCNVTLPTAATAALCDGCEGGAPEARDRAPAHPPPLRVVYSGASPKMDAGRPAT